ncbi:MAG: ABC transporter permease [Armatimonadetes bacterium]|nr:ABC transporter permease [Armatimonadota bacterium]
MKVRIPILFACSIVVIILSLVVVKANIGETVATIFTGSLGNALKISGTIKEMTPLLILGAAVYLALKAGLFNIGAEGQYLVGACFGSYAMIAIGGPIGVAVGCIVGIVGGALWALPAGVIKAYRNGHEVITTIMLNSIALYMTRAIVAGPMKGADQHTASTSVMPANTQLTPLLTIGKLEIPQSFVVGILIVIAIGYWLNKTVSGYELKAAGANPTAAQFAGVKTKQVTVKAMMLSGALAGLAGALQVAQFEHRFYDGFATGYGFDALGVALLAGSNPFYLFLSAFFFGALNKGGTAIAILGVDKGITMVVLAVVILMFASVRYGRKQVNHG